MNSTRELKGLVLTYIFNFWFLAYWMFLKMVIQTLKKKNLKSVVYLLFATVRPLLFGFQWCPFHLSKTQRIAFFI